MVCANAVYFASDFWDVTVRRYVLFGYLVFVSQWRWSSLAWLLGYDSFLFVLHAVALLQYGDGIAGSSKLQL